SRPTAPAPSPSRRGSRPPAARRSPPAPSPRGRTLRGSRWPAPPSRPRTPRRQPLATGSLAAGLDAARLELAAAAIEPEYLEARDAESLEPVTELSARPILVAVATRVGGDRMFGNFV